MRPSQRPLSSPAGSPAARPSQPSSDRIPRTRLEPWPATEWLPENHDVATAQDVMLLAYWVADRLGDAAVSEQRRAAMRAALRAAAPILRNAAEGLSEFAVAAAVRRNGAILGEAMRTEHERVPEGSLLGALLEAHEDEAVHATVGQLRLHSPEVASWLDELERRGRPELRNALRAFATVGGETHESLRRLLAIVMFGTEQLAKRAAKRG